MVCESTTCQDSVCDTDNGLCKMTPKDPFPESCCKTNKDCDDGDDCTINICDIETNTCDLIPLCVPAPPDPDQNPGDDQTCNESSDCISESPCLAYFCANNRCTSWVRSPLPEGCCMTIEDCPAVECRVSFCNFATQECLYEVEMGCQEGSSDQAKTSNDDGEESDEEDSGPKRHSLLNDLLFLTAIICVFVVFVLSAVVAFLYIKKLRPANKWRKLSASNPSSQSDDISSLSGFEIHEDL